MDMLIIIYLVIILLIASIFDLRYQKIPNLLTFPAMIIALVYYSLTAGLNGLVFSAGGLGLGIAIFIIPYLLGGMGAGDAKLMGAVGAVLGAQGVFNAVIFTVIIGGFYSILLLIACQKNCRKFITSSALMVKTLAYTGKFICIPLNEQEEKPKLCYGIAITLGTLFTVWWKSAYNNLPI